MTAEENVAAQITALLDEGSVPRGHCSGGFLQTIRPLLDASVIVEERSGAGRSLVVRDPAALLEFSRRQFPQVPIHPELGARVAGVARFRDSKAFASDTSEMVCLRAWRPGALTKGNEPADAVAATRQHGLFSFLLGSGAGAYALHGRCALVENPVVFTRFERLALDAGAVIYGGGRVSNRFLDWLKHQSAADFELLHLPDYDPVGLNEFERLRSKLANRVRLHLPPDLEERFSRFSKRTLLQAPNSRALLAGLRKNPSPEVRGVVELIHQHNAGLEQEALLLPQ
jgi:hypothetical protein